MKDAIAIIVGLLLVAVAGTSVGAASGADEPVRAGRTYTSGLGPVWEAIVAEAGIDVSYASLPPKRKRRSFVDGYLVLDCCHPKIYRDTPEERATHLFSDPIYYARAHYVFRKGEVVPINKPADLEPYRVAGIRGFDYRWQDHFGVRLDGRDHRDVLNLVTKNRADIGIITGLQYRIEQATNPLPLELGGISAEGYLHASVHVSRPDLLPRINAAIAAMKADERLNMLLLLKGQNE
ncbi:substrate-binding periplasmic protein [Kordiimonas lipolytica]|uniref:Substrate-binding periplasmic protein n=1 Tax=Kordiimonas lipolytica TaxID=1662421 RepID=A0ABV8UDN5_9PROT|nr:ABC transporter substrate-binding protein [Kordiimonas lipolytica]